MDNLLIFTGKTQSGETVKGFFTKKKIGSLIVPVIERIVEHDSGDYVESTEIVDLLPQSEISVLKQVDKMCSESLNPEMYESWEKIKTWLDINRNINQIKL